LNYLQADAWVLQSDQLAFSTWHLAIRVKPENLCHSRRLENEITKKLIKQGVKSQSFKKFKGKSP